MNKPFKQLIKQSARIRLRDHDRETMRAHFTTLLGVTTTAAQPPSAWRMFFITHRRTAVALATIIATIGATGSVAAAAERTIPGDNLYPIKLHVTEEVRSAFARSPASKAAWETKRVERRLTEAEKVIQKKINGATLSTLQLNIAAHTDRVQKSIDTMERGGEMKAAAQASSNIEAPLIAHQKILRELQKKEKGAERLLKAIEDEERFVGSRRKNLEDTIHNELQKDGRADNQKPTNKQPQNSLELFRATERTRRQDREDTVLLKARQELNLVVPNDEENKPEDDASPEAARRRAPDAR